MKGKKSERQDEIALELLQNGKAILFSRTWHEMATKIGQCENVDPDAGFALAYRCPPASALLHHFTRAGNNKVVTGNPVVRLSKYYSQVKRVRDEIDPAC